MRDLLLPGLGVLALSVPLWVAWGIAGSPVAPDYLHSFAKRQKLSITVENGNHVIAYLGTTRRWRAFGLAAGLVVSVLTDLPAVTVNSLPLLAGWFAGALIAELRVLPPPSGPRRAALVSPRKLSSYLGPLARHILPVSAGIAVVIGVIAPVHTFPWNAAAIVVAIAVMVVQRRVLKRAQPAGSADLIAADDAIRSRSLHVLAAGGAALVLFLVLVQLSEFGLVSVAAFVGYLVVAAFCWSVATTPRPVDRAA